MSYIVLNGIIKCINGMPILFFFILRFVTDATDAAPIQKTAIEGAIINGTQIFKHMALSSSSEEQIISTYFKSLSPC